MKVIPRLTFCLFLPFAFAVFTRNTAVFAQSETGLLNTYKYSVYFLNDYGRLDKVYSNAAVADNYNKIAALGGNETSVDTSLEIVLLSFSPGVIDIRPAQAAEMLPSNNIKQADLKLGAALFQEIQLYKFFGSTVSVKRCEEMLKSITDRKNTKREEIEKFYRNNIGILVSKIVDEEFNKVDIHTETTVNRQTRSIGGVLTRNPQNGQYTLNYEISAMRNSRKEISGATLELLSEILDKNEGFSKSALDTVRVQAGMIPATALSDAALREIKAVLTDFYLKPNKSTYTAVVESYKIIELAISNTGNPKYNQLSGSYQIALVKLNKDFAIKVFIDEKTDTKINTLSKTRQQKIVELR